MAKKDPLNIYKILPQTNCRECYLPSCLAFAAAVASGAKKLADCPYVSAVPEQDVADSIAGEEPYALMRAEDEARLQAEICRLSLSDAANRIGARMAGDRMAVTCLGKEFFVDSRGNVTSECHTHCGLTIPLLSHILRSEGTGATGDWVLFRELKGAQSMNALFEQRGEARLQGLADRHPELFNDLIAIFSGESGGHEPRADVSVVLRPLPKLPVLICYWLPEEDLGSKLNIFFDQTADRHLPIESIFELAVGMVMMFEKIVEKHA